MQVHKKSEPKIFFKRIIQYESAVPKKKHQGENKGSWLKYNIVFKKYIKRRKVKKLPVIKEFKRELRRIPKSSLYSRRSDFYKLRPKQLLYFYRLLALKTRSRSHKNNLNVLQFKDSPLFYSWWLGTKRNFFFQTKQFKYDKISFLGFVLNYIYSLEPKLLEPQFWNLLSDLFFFKYGYSSLDSLNKFFIRLHITRTNFFFLFVNYLTNQVVLSVCGGDRHISRRRLLFQFINFKRKLKLFFYKVSNSSFFNSNFTSVGTSFSSYFQVERHFLARRSLKLFTKILYGKYLRFMKNRLRVIVSRNIPVVNILESESLGLSAFHNYEQEYIYNNPMVFRFDYRTEAFFLFYILKFLYNPQDSRDIIFEEIDNLLERKRRRNESYIRRWASRGRKVKGYFIPTNDYFMRDYIKPAKFFWYLLKTRHLKDSFIQLFLERRSSFLYETFPEYDLTNDDFDLKSKIFFRKFTKLKSRKKAKLVKKGFKRKLIFFAPTRKRKKLNNFTFAAFVRKYVKSKKLKKKVELFTLIGRSIQSKQAYFRLRNSRRLRLKFLKLKKKLNYKKIKIWDSLRLFRNFYKKRRKYKYDVDSNLLILIHTVLNNAERVFNDHKIPFQYKYFSFIISFLSILLKGDHRTNRVFNGIFNYCPIKLPYYKFSLGISKIFVESRSVLNSNYSGVSKYLCGDLVFYKFVSFVFIKFFVKVFLFIKKQIALSRLSKCIYIIFLERILFLFKNNVF